MLSLFPKHVISFLCIFLLIGFCFSSSSNQPVILRPLRIHDPSSDLQPRNANPYSRLDLQTQGRLTYGNFPENGSLILANMTLYAPNGMLMVLLEAFDHLTSSIDCQGDDGTMSLTFKSHEAFEYALQAWKFINVKADDKFLLIANHQGCGPDEQRQAYIITSIKEDGVSRTTYLAAVPTPWPEIAGTYDLDFGHVLAHPHPHSLQRRLFGWLRGNFDETRSMDFEPEIGHMGEIQHLWHDDRRLILDCTNCFLRGRFHVTGHIKTHHWKLKEATLSMSPRNFNASLELSAKVTNTEKIDELSHKVDLFSKPIPDLGFEIKHLCKLGVTLAYQAGFSTKLSGSATLDFGAISILPDDSVITIDLKDHEKSFVHLPTGAGLSPVLDIKAISSSLQFAVFTQADIAFGLELKKIWKSDIELNLKIPQLSATINAGYNEDGFCSKDDGASKTGAKITEALGIELWFEVYLGGKKEGKNAFSYKIFNVTDTLDERCQPIPIPNFDEAAAHVFPGLLPMPTDLITPS